MADTPPPTNIYETKIADKIKNFVELYVDKTKGTELVNGQAGSVLKDLKFLFDMRVYQTDRFNHMLPIINDMIGKSTYISNGDDVTKPKSTLFAKFTNSSNLVYPVLEYKIDEQNTPRLYLNFNYKEPKDPTIKTHSAVMEYPVVEQKGGKKNKSKKNKRAKRGRTRRHRKTKMRK
jgi:hypothetical protein